MRKNISLNMNPTHKDNGKKMISDSRETFLCELLDCGGKALHDEAMAFSKKVSLNYLK